MEDVLKIGDKIDIKLLRLFSEGQIISLKKSNIMDIDKNTYVSQVLDFINEDKISIAMPMEGSKLVPVQIGGEYELYFYSKKGLFKCQGIVEERNKEDNILKANIRLTTQLEKIQRRKYYRLEYSFNIKYREITARENNLQRLLNMDELDVFNRAKCELEIREYKKNWKEAILTDLSGGGARFISNDIYPKFTKVKIKLNLECEKSCRVMEIDSKIIYSIKIAESIGKYEQRVEFVNLNDKERENIISFIFNKERELRKNVNL
ncbi:MAG TPA: flagellar brake protein [Clostridiales bacterium]|nr:flagellar brake protein [Clostridiales bacterium]